MENGAPRLQRTAQVVGVADVSVVRQRQPPLAVVDLNGLTVGAVGAACRAVADVPHAQPPGGQAAQDILAENLIDKSQVLVGDEHAVVIDHNAAAFLPPVLERIQPVVNQSCNVGLPGGVHAEHAALLVQGVGGASVGLRAEASALRSGIKTHLILPFHLPLSTG